MLESLFQRYWQHDRQALARLLTLVSRGEEVDTIRAALSRRSQPRAPSASEGSTDPSLALRAGGREESRVVAFTGSGGVGKSTLIGKLIERIRELGQTVAVLACDPQSPLTGGALLGDRFRMPNRPDDPGVFIRSLAAAPGREGVAENLPLMIDLLKAYGFDRVLLETVGAGQGDTAVRDLADAVVLLLQPEAGDDIQWEKAGLLEIADVVVIHKADLPGADHVEAQVRSLLNLPGCREMPVLRVSAAKGQGLNELLRLLDELPGRAVQDSNGRALLRLAQQRLAERFREQAGRVQAVLDRWRRQELGDTEAADKLLQLLSEEKNSPQRRRGRRAKIEDGG